MIKNVTVNRVPVNTSYFCEICGKEHESIEARNACETKCIKERKEAEELMKKQKIEGEKNARKEEIDAIYALLNEKIKDYVNDYGSIRMNRAVKYDGNCPTLSDLFNFWSF
jgi:hypothetical protein